jgi:hypothetical protein
MTLEDYFATGPPHERPVDEAVMAGLAQRLGDAGYTDVGDIDAVYIEPVSVGIFLKRAQTFAELRPMTKWVAVSFVLRRKLTGGRLARKVLSSGSRHWHVVNVRTPEEVDDELLDWLVEAWAAAPD